MKVTSVRDLGALVRSTRLEAGLTQAELATRLGVARDWVVRLEQGHPRLEAQKVLDALAALDLTLDATHDAGPKPGANPGAGQTPRAEKKGRSATRVEVHHSSHVSHPTLVTNGSKRSATGTTHKSAKAGRYVTKKTSQKVSMTPKSKKSGSTASSTDPFDRLFQRR